MPSTTRSRSARGRALTADEITSALVSDTERFAAAIDGASSRVLGDASLFISGIPIASLNGVTTVRTSVTRKDVATLLDEVAASGLPHSLQIRPGCAAGLLDLGRARGMVMEDVPTPLMAVQRGTAALAKAAEHPRLSIRTLDRKASRLLATVSAEGFEEPVEMFERFITPAAWGITGFRAYIGSVDGEPVTTAIASTYGDYVGIFNVATPARHRGRGYGAAITARAVLDGFQSGASVAYLQSSAMGLKVYERLGFRTLETWSVWLTPP